MATTTHRMSQTVLKLQMQLFIPIGLLFSPLMAELWDLISFSSLFAARSVSFLLHFAISWFPLAHPLMGE